MKTVLIVDDEPASRYGLRRALESRYRVVEADSAAAARSALATEKTDLLLLDVILPGEDGISFLRWLRQQGQDVPVLMVSALDTAKTAVEALQLGAADYLVKGFELDELRQRVANLLKMVTLEQENEVLRHRLASEGQFGQMIGRTAAMRRAFELADRVAPTDSTVLILGESGTGKDLLAQEIHARSQRDGKPFVAVNCAALPETLIESELFGYERGAFTGAAQQKKGRFEQAHSGTLFLDEIGDMNPVTQSKVLRALENRTIERLGGTQSIPVDVRVVSATHRILPLAIRDGKFREDLFYRLRVVTIELPPLRAHKEDIPVLVESFVRLHGGRLNRNVRLTKEALAAMERYDWPGNIRELQKGIERAVILCDDDTFSIDESWLQGKAQISNRPIPKKGSLAEVEKEFADRERGIIESALEASNGRVSGEDGAAARLGVPPQTLDSKIANLGIDKRKLKTAKSKEAHS